MSDAIREIVAQHINAINGFFEKYSVTIDTLAEEIYSVFASGGKLMLCGNGGSAADAQHIAAEFVGRFEKERKALPAIALTTDTSALTALANDYSYETIFARQVMAVGKEGDILIGLSTSGSSPNVLAALETAKSMGIKTVLLTGIKGESKASIVDYLLAVPSGNTARIQEVHITALHTVALLVENRVATEL